MSAHHPAPLAPADFAANIARFTGFADLYDRHRARPPDVLAMLATQFTAVARPALVVDLGSGTGLSTRYWAAHAERVVGIEPTPDMRRAAEMATSDEHVSYRAGFSHDTGLPARSAQVVCCMQALHWMEPQATFAEAKRILAPGGVFLACDYDWPPATGAWEADAAWETAAQRGRELERAHNLSAELRQWNKRDHLARMAASGSFRYTRELVVHHREPGDAERFIGLLLSQAYITKLLERGVTESELGLDSVRAIAGRMLGATRREWLWCARVRVGLV